MKNDEYLSLIILILSIFFSCFVFILFSFSAAKQISFFALIICFIQYAICRIKFNINKKYLLIRTIFSIYLFYTVNKLYFSAYDERYSKLQRAFQDNTTASILFVLIGFHVALYMIWFSFSKSETPK